MIIITNCDCNYCGHKFEGLDEDELINHLLSFHPEVKTMDIHIQFGKSEIEKLILGIT